MEPVISIIIVSRVGDVDIEKLRSLFQSIEIFFDSLPEWASAKMELDQITYTVNESQEKET
jgi:hypothetical protein